MPVKRHSNLRRLPVIPNLPVVPIAPNKKPTEVPVQPSWKALADMTVARAQLAISEKHWEDTAFKKEAYKTISKMIATSEGKVREDSETALKKFRWGMEFMDKSQLKDVIALLAQYD
jgi:hypothetical protein